MKSKTYANRCEYYKERNLCSRASFKKSCAKTCTGSGNDKAAWANEYTLKQPIVESTKQFASQCAFYKSKNRCSNNWVKGQCCATW